MGNIMEYKHKFKNKSILMSLILNNHNKLKKNQMVNLIYRRQLNNNKLWLIKKNLILNNYLNY